MIVTWPVERRPEIPSGRWTSLAAYPTTGSERRLSHALPGTLPRTWWSPWLRNRCTARDKLRSPIVQQPCPPGRFVRSSNVDGLAQLNGPSLKASNSFRGYSR
jgi:hypothetical protein